MVDLNLLPEEMRKIEEQKKRDAEKKPPVFEVKLSIPEDEKSDDLKMKGGVFSGVFKRKEKPMPPPPIIPVQKKIDEKNIPGSARGNDFMPRQLPVVHTPDSLVRGEIHIAPPIQGQPVKKPQAPEMKIPIKPELKKTIVLESAPLQIASKKKSGFWAWLKSLFVRRKKEKIYFPKIDKKPELPKLSDIKPLLPELPIKTLEIKKPITPLPPPALMKTQTPLLQEPEIFTFPISEQKKEATKIVPPAPIKPVLAQKPVEKPKPTVIIPPKPQKTPFQKSIPKKDIDDMAPVDTLRINLIPQDLVQHPELEIMGKVVLLVVVALASCLMTFGWYQFVQWRGRDISQKNNELQAQIDSIKKQVLDYDKERQEVEILIAGLSSMENLLGKHIHWTKVFKLLEQNTIDDVYFSNFAASRSGSLRLSASGKDYISVARQLVAFQKATEFVLSVEINSASASGEKDVDGKPVIVATLFDVDIKLQPDVFYVKYE